MNATSKITILKLKRSQTTYMLMVDFSKKNSVKVLKEQLSDIILKSGGLLVDDKTVADADGIDEDDIEVPKSEFIEEDEIEAPKSEALEEQQQEGTMTVASKALRLAIPRDKTAPYNNQWIELTEDNIGDVDFHDYDVVAFAVEDEEFEIVEPSYEDS